MTALADLAGRRFGRLVVTGRAANIGAQTAWACACDCGGSAIVRAHRLKLGETRSCGCLHRETVTANSTTHGGSGTREHRAWQDMKDRCRRRSRPDFGYYGGRGIRVCRRWLGRDGFRRFLADMGRMPAPGLTVDRIDNDGNYEPGNCRWATRLRQGRNSRRNRLIGFNGQRLCVSEWTDATGIKQGTLKWRLDNGWTAAEALTTPARRMKGRDP